MKKLLILIIALAVAATAFAQERRASTQAFASDLQTVPVMANVTGVGGAQFQTYVAIFNPTRNAFAVNVSLFDANGVRHDATIQLAAGELKTYNNFLADVFNYTGGGAVTFSTAETPGGTHNNRFIVTTDIRTGTTTRYSTSVPVLEFAGTSSKSFAAGITNDSTARTNIGCFNQSSSPNTIVATIFDNSGKQNLGTATLTLAGNAWGQTAVTPVVSGGVVQFAPSDSAVCYASVVDNSTNDARIIAAAEYTP